MVTLDGHAHNPGETPLLVPPFPFRRTRFLHRTLSYCNRFAYHITPLCSLRFVQWFYTQSGQTGTYPYE